VKNSWIQLHDFKKAKVLLILPCNAAACIGNYFKAEYYSKKKWNTWREADLLLKDLRLKGQVGFAAVDSATLETKPVDSRGAIVLETEMDRVRNEEGEDWGAPSWRWFRPNSRGKWTYLEELTEALVIGVRRIDSMGFKKVLALVNPKGYFLSLAAAVNKCGLSDSWILFRPPAHPRYLLPSVKEIVPFVQSAVNGQNLQGGIYPIPEIPEHYPRLKKESLHYKDSLPNRWQKFDRPLNLSRVNKRWSSLNKSV